MEKAKVGDMVEFRDGLTGIVEKVNEDFIIVNVNSTDNFKELGAEEKTVVNHKNYKVIHSSTDETS